MLRAVRLSAKLDFSIAPEARAPFAELGELLAQAPPARLFDETLKMFLAGSGLESFRALEQSGLLGAVFPLTARALAFRGDSFRTLVEAGLAGTDARVAEGKSVTPAFLFAVLLWGAVRAQAEREIARGVEPNLAWQRVSHQVIAEQAKHVAIPRRFGQMMQEIWVLQPRFVDRQKKRVFRLLTHPRFRGAYDFLLLRAAEGEDIAELGRWWTHAQATSHEALAEELSAAPAEATGPADATKKRRRRRRKPRAPAATA
jgi:poly(A) polymerase